MDILHLVDRLEELMDRGWRLPVGNRVVLDEDALLNILDQMRITIPQEIKQAREIQREREKVVTQAHEEARRILAQAREDAAQLLDEHKLRRQAEEQAVALFKRAQQEAAQIRAGADEYAEGRLRELGQTITQLQAVIQNGVEALANRRAQYLKESAAAEAKPAEAAAPSPPAEMPPAPVAPPKS
jgi:vacuolar-type H+-ATPase subunit H